MAARSAASRSNCTNRMSPCAAHRAGLGCDRHHRRLDNLGGAIGAAGAGRAGPIRDRLRRGRPVNHRAAVDRTHAANSRRVPHHAHATGFSVCGRLPARDQHIHAEPRGRKRNPCPTRRPQLSPGAAGDALLSFFREGNRTSLQQLHRRFVTGPVDWTVNKIPL